jgi:hypothetical protein
MGRMKAFSADRRPPCQWWAASCIVAIGCALAPAVQAGPAAPAPSPAPAAAPASAAARSAATTRVIEDDQVRIEETRVRGQVRRIVVAPKGPQGQAAAPYEISVGAGGRDPSQDPSSAGQRVWPLFRF